MKLTDKDYILALLKKHNKYTTKLLGQNFLLDNSALETIIETAKISNKDLIVEIGPGLGVLTKELATNAKKIISIELDQSLLPILEETIGHFKKIEIINQDALTFIPPKEKYKVVANIPYNITSPLLNHFLQAANPPESMTLLVQKEVAEKICTLKNNTSILSLQVSLFGTPSYIKTIPGNSFFPAPKVDSAIIHIQLLPKTSPNYIPTEEAKQILKLAKRAFSQKRKKLSNSLPEMKDSLEQLELKDKRPEHLTIKDWQALLKFND